MWNGSDQFKMKNSKFKIGPGWPAVFTFLICNFALSQPVPPTTAFTRYLMTSTNQAQFQSRAGIDTNGVGTTYNLESSTNLAYGGLNDAARASVTNAATGAALNSTNKLDTDLRAHVLNTTNGLNSRLLDTNTALVARITAATNNTAQTWDAEVGPIAVAAMTTNYVTAKNVLRELQSGITNLTDLGAVPDDGIDDSGAIQAALQLADDTERFWTVLVPDGVYNISTNYTTNANTSATAYSYAQIHIPGQNYNSQRTVGVKFQGVSIPQFNMNWTTNDQQLATNGAFFVSTNIPGLTHNPTHTNTCVFGVAALTLNDWSRTAFRVVLENLTFRSQDIPPSRMLDFTGVGEVEINNVQIDTGVILGDISEPTNYANSVAITLPGYANWTDASLQNVSISGYGQGIQFGEHATLDKVKIWNCKTAFVPNNGVGGTFASPGHSSSIGYTLAVSCATNIAPLTSLKVSWEHYSSEHSVLNSSGTPAWRTFVADLHDPASMLRGFINFSALNGGGSEANWIQTSATGITNLSIRSLYKPVLLERNIPADYGSIVFGQANTAASLNPAIWSYISPSFSGPYLGWNVPSGGLQINNLANSANLVKIGGQGMGVLLQSSSLQFGSYTNSTAPADTATVKAWINFTNATGGQFKIPLYQ